MKWFPATFHLLVTLCLIVTVMSASGSQSSGDNGDTVGVVNSFQTARMLLYSAATKVTVRRVHVRRGDRIHQGDPLLTLSHGGKETTLKATCPATVDNLYVQEGREVEAQGQLLDVAPKGSEEQSSKEEEEGSAPPIVNYLLHK